MHKLVKKHIIGISDSENQISGGYQVKYQFDCFLILTLLLNVSLDPSGHNSKWVFLYNLSEIFTVNIYRKVIGIV